MRSEIEPGRSIERRDRLLGSALQTLIIALGLDMPRHHHPARLPPAYVELLNQLEDEPDWSRSVTDRARRLGYSQRTLTRACLSAAGRTAKEVIDDRVLLEAQRLLSDRRQPIAAVGAQLGFTEQGNFSRFFLRMVGEGPASWRDRTWPPDLPLPVSEETRLRELMTPATGTEPINEAYRWSAECSQEGGPM